MMNVQVIHRVSSWCSLIHRDLRLNCDVVSVFAVSSNDVLEGVLQLGKVQPGLGLTVPAAQHELVPVVKIYGKGNDNKSTVANLIMACQYLKIIRSIL